MSGSLSTILIERTISQLFPYLINLESKPDSLCITATGILSAALRKHSAASSDRSRSLLLCNSSQRRVWSTCMSRPGTAFMSMNAVNFSVSFAVSDSFGSCDCCAGRLRTPAASSASRTLRGSLVRSLRP